MSATSDTSNQGYVHYVPKSVVNTYWPSKYNFYLVDTIEQLEEFFSDFEEGKTVFSYDCETTGLNPEIDKIVGFSLAKETDMESGYYVPVNHFKYKNNLGKKALDLVYSYMKKAKIVAMANARFDIRFLEYYNFDKSKHGNLSNPSDWGGYDCSMLKVFDVIVAAWLSDTNNKACSLKWASEHFLGIKQQSFEEVSGGAENFYYVTPENATYYAASDALCTLLLIPATMKYFKESGFAGKYDMQSLIPIMRCENEKIMLDIEKISEFMKQATEQLSLLERKIYKKIGYTINLNSPAQVGKIFQDNGIDTGVTTSSGNMSVSESAMENISEEILKKYPMLKWYREYKTLQKLKSSYIQVLYDSAKELGYVRCNYKTTQVPTGRFASGSDLKQKNKSKDLIFFSPFNIQSTPKPHPLFYYAVDSGDREMYSKADNIILGYKFIPVLYGEDKKILKYDVAKELLIEGGSLLESEIDWDCLGIAEGFHPNMNIRSAFSAKQFQSDGDEDWLFCSIDYAAQELRITTNLSGENVWGEAFLGGGDIHKDTAIKIWGKENYDKEKRKMAKGANFSKFGVA